MTTLGVDIGGTSTRMVLLAGGERVIAERRYPTSIASGDGFVAALAGCADEMLREEGMAWSAIAATGIAIAAPVDSAGRLPFVAHLPLGDEYPLAEKWRQLRPGPLVVVNDLAGALEAERRWGAARGLSQAVMVSISTGIGSAILAGGRILTSPRGVLGEVGHMAFSIGAAARSCPCGRNGCWEASASGRAAGQRWEEAGGTGGAEGLVAAVRAGETRAVAVLRGVAEDIGRGLSSLVLILGPECFILYGGFGLAAWPYLEPTVRETLERRRTLIPFVLATVGDHAGAAGAAALATDIERKA